MVYYYQITVNPDTPDVGYHDDYTIYMGKDKFENDPLIKNSNPEDLWFHVDNYSSAHLYLELKEDERNKKIEDLKLHESILSQMAQMTKANSIKANKLNNITVIYTKVKNLHTDGTMDVGTVTFKSERKVKRIHVGKKDNAVVNRINKTKSEISTKEFLDLQDAEMRQKHREAKEQQRSKEKQMKETSAKKKQNSDPYADLFTQEAMHASSNEFREQNWVEDDFW